MIDDVEREYGASIHVGECRSCKSRVLTCHEGVSTTTHEFLTKFISLTVIKMNPESQLEVISYWAGNGKGVDQLEKDTGYDIFKDFDSFENEQSGPHSIDYLGVRLKEIVLSPERLEIS